MDMKYTFIGPPPVGVAIVAMPKHGLLMVVVRIIDRKSWSRSLRKMWKKRSEWHFEDKKMESRH
jgi:hypothetical protein